MNEFAFSKVDLVFSFTRKKALLYLPIESYSAEELTQYSRRVNVDSIKALIEQHGKSLQARQGKRLQL